MPTAERFQAQRTGRNTIKVHYLDAMGRHVVGQEEEIGVGESLNVIDVTYEALNFVLPPGNLLTMIEQDASTGVLRIRERRRDAR